VGQIVDHMGNPAVCRGLSLCAHVNLTTC